MILSTRDPVKQNLGTYLRTQREISGWKILCALNFNTTFLLQQQNSLKKMKKQKQKKNPLSNTMINYNLKFNKIRNGPLGTRKYTNITIKSD